MRFYLSRFPFAVLFLTVVALFLGAPRLECQAEAAQRQYSYTVNALDPSAETNPSGAAFPGYRGPDQMVLYTSVFGSSTRTNTAGLEAAVENNVITRTGGGDLPIPVDGFIVSGHGSAAQWMQRFAKPGAAVTWDEATRHILIRMTPQVYLHEVDEALQRAEGRSPVNEPEYAQALNSARACRNQLTAMHDAPVSEEMIALSRHCIENANQAFYRTIASVPGEFRGAWIRTDSTDPERIRKTVAQLKEFGIGHVFLETYYQGKTIYPSRVMTEAGLPVQHPRFKGQDPLRLWMDEAHTQGLKVYPWVQVFFAGNAQENAEQYGPILQKYPQWRNVQRRHANASNPVPSAVEPGHYFVDPAHPEVRAFLEKLLLEIVSQYPVDGINLDYIRYPASLAAGKPGYLESTWGYTESARTQFKAMIDAERQEAEAERLEALKKAGKPMPKVSKATPLPSSDPIDLTPGNLLWQRWMSWRTEQVSSFVKTISEKAQALRPGLLISAVVFPTTDPAYAQKLQDYPRWAKEGYIQGLTPIGLSPNPAWMERQASQLRLQVQDRVPIYTGIFGMYNRSTPVELVSQIDAAHKAGLAGVVLFDWSRLNPEYRDALLQGPFRE